jgi:signal transduction histidine kinase
MTPQAISQATVVKVRTTPRPPLTKRLRPGHWTAIDYFVGVLYGLIIFAIVRASISVAPNPIGPAVAVVHVGPGRLVTLGVAVGVALSVATRRRHPMTSLCLLLGGSILIAVLTIDGNDMPALALFAPTAYVLYLIVATFEDRRKVGQALTGIFLTMLVDMAILSPDSAHLAPHLGDFVPAVLSVAVGWSLGYIVRQRRRYAIGLQEEAASKAVAVERLRIARELHDVVAHSMSVIAVQAGYGQYVIDSQPADAKDALGAIQTTSREALEEMRRMLGALRYADETPAAAPAATTATPATPTAPAAVPAAGLFRPEVPFVHPEPTALQDGLAAGAAPLFPAPGLADLDRLIARTASAGVRVEVHCLGTPRDLPSSIDLSAYRIIQEALTNVVKHAHASRCSVLLDYGDEELTIEVTDSGAGVPQFAYATAGAYAMAGGGSPASAIPSGGHGIIGMRERVSLLGGEFAAGPLPGYGFQVTARIPVPSP